MRTTGASIIDHVLGGYPPGLPLVLVGPSGCGRTVLSLQLACAALLRGERVQIVSSEPAQSLTHQADALGFDLDAALADDQLVLLELDAGTPSLVRAQGVDALVEALRAEAPEAELVVIDPFTAITAEIVDESRLREVSRSFVRAIGTKTLVLTVESERLAQQRGLERVLSELCGAYLSLGREPSGRRTLRVEKSRSGLVGAAESVEFSIGPSGTHLVGDAKPKSEVPLFTRVRRAERPAAAAVSAEFAAPVGAIEAPRRQPARRPRMPHAPSTGSEPHARSERDRPLVLLVEDSRLQRELVSDWLCPRYDVITANDGFEALAKVVSSDPDLVILDLIMPRVSGYELLAALRRAGMDVPVLVCSSRLTSAGDRLAPLVLGATDFLPKPVSRIELEHKVETLLRLRRTRDQRFDGPETEALFGRLSTTRMLTTPEFRERTARAVSFGERHGMPSTVATLLAGDEADLTAWIDTANEELRFEDAVLRSGKLEVCVLLVATGSSDSMKVLERITSHCADAIQRRPELVVEVAPADEWLDLAATGPAARPGPDR